MFKYLFCLLAAFCVYQAAASDVSDGRSNIADIIKSIKEALQKIQETLKNLISQAKQIYQQVHDKIQEIIKQLDLPQIIKDIKAKLDDILKKAGVSAAAAKKCLDAEREPAKDIFTSATASLQECLKAAHTQTTDLRNEITTVVKDAGGFILDANKAIVSCVTSNLPDINKILSCLINENTEIQNNVKTIQDQITKVANQAKQTIPATVNSFTQCTAKIQTDVQQKETAIFNNFSNCVNQIKPKTA